MQLGFETIGNATIIIHDKTPVLVTDPWIEGDAYFGSWTLSHEIPPAQKKSILSCPFVWFSHSHPDHLNGASLPYFKDKRILIPDHVGGRMKTDLIGLGYNVTVLQDWKWISLSDKVKVLCISDMGQDAVLLINAGGNLLVNSNDCGDNGWNFRVKRLAKKFKESFLFRISGYGDADMMNFYDEEGKAITPAAAKKNPIGKGIAETTDRLGIKYFAPSSSQHMYQREDSAWANAYIAESDEYNRGFSSNRSQLLPAFIRYDLLAKKYELINPKANARLIKKAAEFGDNWNDVLEKEDLKLATSYFQAVESLYDTIGFINLETGGKDNLIPLNKTKNFGITFECPRHSLTEAIKYEVFEDLLIGNYMKVTLHGKLLNGHSLHPYFSGYVCKFADNGRAKSKKEVAAYLNTYRKRSLEFRIKSMRWQAQATFEKAFPRNSPGFRVLRSLYRRAISFAS